MEPRINVVTLAVSDLEASLRFYRDGLGLQTEGVVGTEYAGTADEPGGRVAMFQLADGLVLSLYPASELAKDAGVADVAGHGFSLGHVVGSRREVDDVLAAAAAAGSTVSRVGERPWGIYSGYFTDPDGHLWEVMHFQAE